MEPVTVVSGTAVSEADAGGSPLVRASGWSLVASHSWVRCPSRRSSGAPGPPILVGTQPGSTALLDTSGQSRATAQARAVTNSLLSEYEPVLRCPLQSMPARSARPPECMPLLR